MSWGQRGLYKALSVFIDEVTKQKIVLAGDGTPEAMTDMFHPSQLEQRFGGDCPRPKNFWPPQMGTEFIAEREKAVKHTNLITTAEYESIIAANEGLMVHPEYLNAGNAHRNMHWKMEEQNTSEIDLLHQSTGSLMNSNRLYLDANTGLDQIEEHMAVANLFEE